MKEVENSVAHASSPQFSRPCPNSPQEVRPRVDEHRTLDVVCCREHIGTQNLNLQVLDLPTVMAESLVRCHELVAFKAVLLPRSAMLREHHVSGQTRPMIIRNRLPRDARPTHLGLGSGGYRLHVANCWTGNRTNLGTRRLTCMAMNRQLINRRAATRDPTPSTQWACVGHHHRS